MLTKQGLRDFGKRRIRDLFELGQRLGLDVLPRHFYSSIPDMRELRASDDWKHRLSMYGVPGVALESQTDFLDSCCREGSQRPAALEIYADACRDNGAVGYGPIEAGFLHRFVSARRPRRAVQVGAGVATSVTLAAAGSVPYEIELTCIDPYPTPFLRDTGAAGRIRLLEEKAQTVIIDVATSLEGGDLLFVDSTHTVKPGSEVNRIILEVLPRLKPGVYVHFHDIYFPYDYSPGILTDDLFFWNETPLLHAFLINNSSVHLRLAMSMVHHGRPDALKRWFADYQPRASMALDDDARRRRTHEHFPSSAYLEVVG